MSDTEDDASGYDPRDTLNTVDQDECPCCLGDPTPEETS